MYERHLHGACTLYQQSKNVLSTTWYDTQVGELHAAVLLHMSEPHWSDARNTMTNEQIRWTAVAKELNRSTVDCRAQWQKKLKKGNFTGEEDALIKQRVAEWGDKGKGLWSSLQMEFDRPAAAIKYRWYVKLNTDNL